MFGLTDDRYLAKRVRKHQGERPRHARSAEGRPGRAALGGTGQLWYIDGVDVVGVVGVGIDADVVIVGVGVGVGIVNVGCWF